MNLRIRIAWSTSIGSWSWSVTYNDVYAYGYENDYENAERKAREAARRMGADL